MSKKARKTPDAAVQPAPPIGQEAPAVAEKASIKVPAVLHKFWVQALTIVVLAFGCYFNTFHHEYALDDTVVIVRNDFVHRGFAGINHILTKDAYYSYYKQLNTTNQLTGGRYRPLSIVTFAIEQQLMGPVKEGDVDSVIAYGLSYDMQAPYEKKFLREMHVRHVMNVVCYALACVVLLYFLRYIVFRNNYIIAFLATIIFTLHPLHTEVVANVKSRDEILSVLFICLTFINAFRYKEKGGIAWLAAGMVSFILALLSKEYAVTLVVLLPLSFYLFRKDTISKSLLATVPYIVVVAAYLLVRWSILGPRNELSETDIQINPYAFASAHEKLATVIATSLDYFRLLLLPYPLSSDYSYPQIPYKDFGDWIVWLSAAFHVGLAGLMIYFMWRRSMLCFAIAFYLLNLLLVNNFLFDIGATMGERLIFHSSIGFAIVGAWILYELMAFIKFRHLGKWGLVVLILKMSLTYGSVTFTRNKDWKNDETLFFHDIKVVPNSFLVNANVACMLVNKSDFEKDEKVRVADLERGIKLFTRVLSLQDNYVLAYMNRGVAYYKLGNADSLVADLDRVNRLYPIHPQLPDMYYRAAGIYSGKHEYEKEQAVLERALRLNPNDRAIRQALDSVKTKVQPRSDRTGIDR